jgi:hypothetical protein
VEAGAHFETSTQCVQRPDLSWDCACPDNLYAVSGGASSGPSARLNANEAGQLVGLGWQSWHVSCVNRYGAAISCQEPFAICGPL